MNIVWCTSEAVPYAKTGGLADVSNSLPRALAERGHTVSVLMPFYNWKMNPLDLRYDRTVDLLDVPFGSGTEFASIRVLNTAKNLTFYFIEFNRFFDRPKLYDWNGSEYADNAERFIFFSRACMQTILKLGLDPDILHLNDWHTALCAVYLRSLLYSGQTAFRNCRSVLTIHNVGYQGNFPQEKLYWTGLGWEYFNFRCLEFYNRINLLKGGIMCSDFVSTVSPTYAEEILSPQYGFGLDSSLRHCAFQGHLRGILNGIDVSAWDPAHDKNLPAVFSAKKIQGKKKCKQALLKAFHLPDHSGEREVPLFGVLSRLAFQKGLDVFADSLEEMLRYDDAQFVLIGSGDPYLEWRFSDLAGRYPDKFGVYIGMAKDSTSHLLEAGSDFFIMPSRYEPCGLNQMYSMRYGTLPIVRSTGGLADTVHNYHPEDLDRSSGFVFWDLNPVSLRNTIRWAADTFRKEPEAIRRMRLNGMTTDFSWNHTAQHYEEMYHDAHK